MADDSPAGSFVDISDDTRLSSCTQPNVREYCIIIRAHVPPITAVLDFFVWGLTVHELGSTRASIIAGHADIHVTTYA